MPALPQQTSVFLTVSRPDAAALPFLERTSKLDPTFVMVFLCRSVGYRGLDESEQAVRYATKAHEVSNRLASVSDWASRATTS